ncbi:hypothetical protein SCHPADRAFT_505208 [Schizopora paradoxa]|uniref:Uncharacterized protein n=1 Tax=Schizopora paradoxa TaxID=27342 RepID=A0A0H2RGI8_9AGAM|nr:hypothetical protein SCHPADRAFT_505208 [Schizopora paradoxa]
MGGAASKLSRRLPTKPQQSWNGGARVDIPQQNVRQALASETRNQGEQLHVWCGPFLVTAFPAIDMDARDPHFMQKLNQLGPVKVDHNMTAVKTGAHVKDMLHSRDISEQQASSSAQTRNKVLAGSLHQLLEERKNVRSRDELTSLANSYGMDETVLERLAQTINTPSIAEETRRMVTNESGEERMTVMAKWVENNNLQSN